MAQFWIARNIFLTLDMCFCALATPSALLPFHSFSSQPAYCDVGDRVQHTKVSSNIHSCTFFHVDKFCKT